MKKLQIRFFLEIMTLVCRVQRCKTYIFISNRER